jgi:glutaconate CoA-transferase subunit B
LALGKGPTVVITDLCIMRPDAVTGADGDRDPSRRARQITLQRGGRSDSGATRPRHPPTSTELEALYALLDRTRRAHGE